MAVQVQEAGWYEAVEYRADEREASGGYSKGGLQNGVEIGIHCGEREVSGVDCCECEDAENGNYAYPEYSQLEEDKNSEVYGVRVVMHVALTESQLRIHRSVLAFSLVVIEASRQMEPGGIESRCQLQC